VSVEGDHEKERQMVSVPEDFKGLFANLVVGSAVHDHTDEKHEMTSDASRLRIVDLQCKLRSDF
jgi:hypothetical protein